jgi:5'-nucleotidase
MRHTRRGPSRWLVSSLAAALLVMGVAPAASAHPSPASASGKTSVAASTTKPATPAAAAATNPGKGRASTPGKPASTPGKGKPDQTGKPTFETIQILNVSDFHGQLDPTDVFGVGNVGGAAALATYFQRDRAVNPNTLLFTAGDAVGASPPLSSFFEDRPTIEWMNEVRFTADSLGNHNFDFGLERLQDQIDLAEFDYLAANLDIPTGELTGVKPYEIYEVAGVNVAVIGLTNPEAPELTLPGSLGGITITDPVEAAIEAREAARREGATVFVVLPHMGVTNIDDAGTASGPLIDLADSLEGFDLILGDHTDVQFADHINGALVTENRSKGLTYSKVDLEVNVRNGKVVDSTVEFVTPLAADVEPDANTIELLAPYRVALAEAFDGEVGIATDFFPRGGNIERDREVAIGNLIADSMRVAYGTDVAFTNGGGIRAPLPSSYLPQDTLLRRLGAPYQVGPPFDLVVGDIYEVLPFGNDVLTRTVTGAQLHAVLEHGVAAMPAANGRFPQISGFEFTYDVAAVAGSRVTEVVLDDGTPVLRDGTTYTLATNNFVNAGGDGYTMLADGGGVTRDLMANVLLDHVEELGTITPTVDGRITRLN